MKASQCDDPDKIFECEDLKAFLEERKTRRLQMDLDMLAAMEESKYQHCNFCKGRVVGTKEDLRPGYCNCERRKQINLLNSPLPKREIPAGDEDLESFGRELIPTLYSPLRPPRVLSLQKELPKKKHRVLSKDEVKKLRELSSFLDQIARRCYFR